MVVWMLSVLVDVNQLLVIELTVNVRVPIDAVDMDDIVTSNIFVDVCVHETVTPEVVDTH